MNNPNQNIHVSHLHLMIPMVKAETEKQPIARGRAGAKLVLPASSSITREQRNLFNEFRSSFLNYILGKLEAEEAVRDSANCRESAFRVDRNGLRGVFNGYMEGFEYDRGCPDLFAKTRDHVRVFKQEVAKSLYRFSDHCFATTVKQLDYGVDKNSKEASERDGFLDDDAYEKFVQMLSDRDCIKRSVAERCGKDLIVEHWQQIIAEQIELLGQALQKQGLQPARSIRRQITGMLTATQGGSFEVVSVAENVVMTCYDAADIDSKTPHLEALLRRMQDPETKGKQR